MSDLKKWAQSGQSARSGAGRRAIESLAALPALFAWATGPVSSAAKVVAERFKQNIRMPSDFRRETKRSFDPFLDDKRILIQAAADGDLQTLREITAKRPQCVDAKLSAVDLAPGQELFKGLTPLMAAIRMNEVECVRHLAPLSDLSLRGDDGMWKMKERGRTALMRAASQGPEMFRMLWPFATKEAINVTGAPFGGTALMEAILAQNHEAVATLAADERCDLSLTKNRMDGNGPDTALILAAGSGQPRMLAILLPRHSEESRIAAFEKSIQNCLAEEAHLDTIGYLTGAGASAPSHAWPAVDMLAFHVPAEVANKAFAGLPLRAAERMPLWAGRVAAEKEARELGGEIEIVVERAAPGFALEKARGSWLPSKSKKERRARL